MPAYAIRRVVAGGTVTVNTPLLDHTQTWNDAAVTFTGWKLNVTDTASGSGSLLLDLQVSGSSKFSVDKGGLTATGGALVVGSSDIWVKSSVGRISWSDPQDLFLLRDAANTLAQRNGTNAQTLRVYNTYTDGSNYERGFIDWSSEANTLRIGSEAAGTGTKRGVVFQGAAIAFRPLIGSNTTAWQFNTSGHLVTIADNTYDIGASGATRPRNIYAAGTLSFGTHAAIAAETVTGYITVTDAAGTTRKLAVVS